MHIIFDLDGTLLDTEFDISEVVSILAATKGCEISAEDVFKNFSGLNLAAKFEGIAVWCGVKLAADDIQKLVSLYRLAELQAQSVGLVFPHIEGVPALLDLLEKDGHILSLGSSNVTARSKALLDIAGLRHHFNDRVFGPDNSGGKPKPDPGVFLQAIASAPERTDVPVVIEDSTAGVTAGHAAGAFVIARLDPRFGDGEAAAAKTAEFKRAGADVVIRDFADLKENLPAQCKHNIKRRAP